MRSIDLIDELTMHAAVTPAASVMARLQVRASATAKASGPYSFSNQALL